MTTAGPSSPAWVRGTYEVRVGTLLAEGAGHVRGAFTAPMTAQVATPGAPRDLVLRPDARLIRAEWDAPSNPDPDHAGYVVQYRKAGSTTWMEWRRLTGLDARSTTIINLEAGTTYEVRVGTLRNLGTSEGPRLVPGLFSAVRRAEAAAARPPGAVRDLEAAHQDISQRRLALPPGLLGGARGLRQPAGHRGLLGAVPAGRGLPAGRDWTGAPQEYCDQTLGRDSRHRVRRRLGGAGGGHRPAGDGRVRLLRPGAPSSLGHQGSDADSRRRADRCHVESPGRPGQPSHMGVHRLLPRGRLPHLAAVPAAGQRHRPGPSTA